MELYEALYTTRAMRRLKPDPIPMDAQARILDAAIRAPSGGNTQRWRFMLVDDADLKAALGPIYRDSARQLWESESHARRIATAQADPEEPEQKRTLQLIRSAQHLADRFEKIPLLLFAFSRSDSDGSSIFPSIWSAMLAARAERIGTCLTTILWYREAEVLELLGVPNDEAWRMAACVTFGYPTGPWGVARRQPVHEVSFRNGWNQPVGFEVPEPLWPGEAP